MLYCEIGRREMMNHLGNKQTDELKGENVLKKKNACIDCLKRTRTKIMTDEQY